MEWNDDALNDIFATTRLDTSKRCHQQRGDDDDDDDDESQPSVE